MECFPEVCFTDVTWQKICKQKCPSPTVPCRTTHRVVEQLRPPPFSGVWCAVSARNIIGPMSVVNKSNIFVQLHSVNCSTILRIISRREEKEEMYCHLMKDSSMAHAANCTVAVLEEIFSLQDYQI